MLYLIDNNIREETLPGIPPSATVIYLGYVENIADPLHPHIMLICPDGAGEEPAWEIELHRLLPWCRRTTPRNAGSW
jgi:hypothetical protein